MTLRRLAPVTWTRASARIAAALVVAAFAGAAVPAAAQRPHVHGQALLEVALDGARLSVTLHAPLEVLVGFERPPRGPAEHRTVERMLTQLKEGAALVRTTLAAGCVLLGHHVEAPVLKVGAKADGEHADLEASWDFECLQPEQLSGFDVGFFDRFSRLQKLDVKLATPQGQRQVALARPAKRVDIPR